MYDTFEETDSEEERQMAKAAEYVERKQQEGMDVDNDWPIHRGYLTYTLEDVALENNKDILEQWLERFTPSAQPRSEEEHFYVRLMATAISQKLKDLPH